MSHIYRAFIITAGNLTASKAKCEAKNAQGQFLHAGLPGHFKTALSPSGSLPATHYISAGLFSDAEAAYLEAQLPASLTVSDGTTKQTIEGVLTTVPEGPHELLKRLGLKIISPAV